VFLKGRLASPQIFILLQHLPFGVRVIIPALSPGTYSSKKDKNLKIDTELLEDQQAKLTVEIDDDIYEQAKRRAARKIAKRVKIPGFRPGKAPYNIVERQVGEAAIHEEGLEIIIREEYPKIIEGADIEPYGPGQLENVTSLDPLVLEIVVPMMPDVELGDYQSIRVPYEPVEIEEADIEEVIEDLRERNAIEEPVVRPAQEGDHLHIRLSGKKMNVEDESDSQLIQERTLPVFIEREDADTASEWPFPGFSRELIGLSAGDEKQLTHEFSEDSDFTSLRGVEAEFTILVEDLKKRVLPEVDDEFAQSLGDFADVEALRAEIRADLETHRTSEYLSEFDDQIIDQAIDQATIKYPPQMLENEIDEVIHQLGHRLQGDNLDLETYLKIRGIDEDGLREEARPVAESRLERSLVLLEIAQVEEIEVQPEELQHETERTLQAMTRFMSEAEIKKLPTKDLIANLAGNILADMRMDRTLQFLRSLASDGAYPLPEEDTDDAVVVHEPEDSEETTTPEPTESEGETLPGEEEQAEDQDIESIEEPSPGEPIEVEAESIEVEPVGESQTESHQENE